MINLCEIYEKTGKGMEVILHYYPQAREVVGTKNKFRVRKDEKTPSAVLYLKKLKSGEEVWTVCDFGDDGHAMTPLDICMKEEGITRVYEAVLKLASIFDIRDELNRSVNKPRRETRPAHEDEREGERVFSLLERIPEEHFKVLGPKVTKDDTEALHWFEAEYVGYVKNREVHLKYSTPEYPIFMRECVVEEDGGKNSRRFWKIYEPLNPDKGFRFSYTPAGAKPRDYINGLYELKMLYRKHNAEEERKFRMEPGNEDKPFKEEKIREAIICSGERDALCCHSMGYLPLWFNSETYRLEEHEYREIMKYVDTLYNIPDIDATGRAKGRELALRFIDIHTVWLPERLREFRDNRGKRRKDLKDWMELRDRRSDFQGLMELAMPARFWTERVNQKTKQTFYDIDTDCLYNFLRLNGFFTLHDENVKEARYVRVEGSVVSEVRAKDLRRFVSEWALERCLPRPVRNLIYNSPRLSDSALDNLKEIALDFTNFTPTTQLFFFPRKTIEATPTGLVEHSGGDGTIDRYVWRENVLPHNVRLLPPMFHASHEVDERGRDRWRVKVLDAMSSPIFGYVINTSRTHWRKELEYNFEGESPEARRAYFESHRFTIDGEGLTKEEREEQGQNLASKLFAIGYMLHHYKSPSRAWAPMAMDNKIGEDGECNGRSGKSFLFKALSLFMKTVKLSGRNPKLMDNPHVFDQVTQHTDFVLVDDCDRYLSTEQFYDLITSDMTVNPKNNQSYTIPFDQSPKFGFTTNYVPRDFDASTEARLLYLVFSDYYHQRTENNDYLETRSIRDDFGRDLISSTYPEEMWNADICFFMQCAAFYLSLVGENVKPMPPMQNILKRKFKADMGANFEDWAYTYFAEDGDHLDQCIVRRTAYEDFINDAKVNKNFYTMQKFTKALRSFAALCPHVYEYNPQDLQNSQGRISRRIDGKVEDMVFLRSRKMHEAQERLRRGEHLKKDATFVPDELTNEDAPPQAPNTPPQPPQQPVGGMDGCPF